MTFIQQAYKGKNKWWRYLMMCLFVFFGWQVLGILPLLITATFYSKNMTELNEAAADNFMGLGIDNNLYLFCMLFSFVVALVFIFIGIKIIHKRSIKTLLTSRHRIDWQRIFFAFGLWFTISLTLLFIDYLLAPESYVWNFNPIPFLILVVISFLLLPLQTGFEEILFRGYLMQGIGIGTKSAWVSLLLTALLFGGLHILNPEVETLGYLVMIYYVGTGLLFGITTLMDEGLEIAIGMHCANNIVAAVFVTTHWSVFQTDALFLDVSEPDLALEAFIPVCIIYPLLLFLFSKKYGWKNWQNKLLGKIEEPSPTLPEDKSP